MKQKRFGFMGASSVLMIFIVLCLTAFGVLSLVSARADLRLTGKAQAATEAYHAAKADTEALICTVDQKLAEARTEVTRLIGDGVLSAAQAPAKYTALLRDSLSSLEGVRLDGERIILTVTADDGREIHTELRLLPLAEKERYRVVSQKLYAPQSESMADEGLDLWTGN